MDKNYNLLADGSFVINDYNRTYPFSNFLPGVAGVWGVPIWVFYVNRAQGVISFGIGNKDNCMSEFYPANKAYTFVPNVGFRTFVKVDGKAEYEPFKVVNSSDIAEEMTVKSASLEIKEVNRELGLEFRIKYFTLPNCTVGGLVREVRIKNISRQAKRLEVIDGHARVIPFGLKDLFLKYLARTMEAWMHSAIENNTAIFRLSVDPEDVSQTRYIEGANFNYSFYEEQGKKIYPTLIVDPQIVFSYDTSCAVPAGFFGRDFDPAVKQITCCKTPCAFSHFKWGLKPGEEKTFYSIFGASFKTELIKKFTGLADAVFLCKKDNENTRVVDGIKDNALCVSSSEEFDHYVKSCYLDNVLRGGYPYSFNGADDTYYVFSRKHGDLERDYNKFQLLPSYFSEGEGNYRDMNQNRRLDLLFNPALGRKNMAYFLNLGRIDGYNPLVVQGEKLYFQEKAAAAFLRRFDIHDKKLLALMVKGFYLGEFFKFVEEDGIVLKNREKTAAGLVKEAQREITAEFGEGFWIDHWRYNLDLIESYLYVYPDRMDDLFLNKEYVFWDDEYRVKERSRRYTLHEGRVYQWHSVEPVKEKKDLIAKRQLHKNMLRAANGRVYHTNLAAKLLTVILNKTATLDPCGIGVEMEADKPGWCDSLNGLPAMFGSSLCETLETKRACRILLDACAKLKRGQVKGLDIAEEIHSFYARLNDLLEAGPAGRVADKDFQWWTRSNHIKEDFREKTFDCVSGKEVRLSLESLEQFLTRVIEKLDRGIKKAKEKESGVHTTYFMYKVTKYTVRNNVVTPVKFERVDMPLFLEGAVHGLRVEKDRDLHSHVKKSSLFDKKLKMYRLNASLADQPLEIGRSRIFVPGWLENESIWLHMEYKYLLEILKSGFYEDFYNDFYNCLVCFFQPQVYGRSILENSSFIVSSAHPDENLWGKGFVARLSGATVELINIWALISLGKHPFSIDSDGRLCLKFSPALKGEMFTFSRKTIDFQGKEIVIDKDCFAFSLFASTLIVYHNPERKDTYAADCRIRKMVIETASDKHIIEGDTINYPLSEAVRKGDVSRIDVHLA